MERLYEIWFNGVLNRVWAKSRFEAAQKVRQAYGLD